MFENQLKDGCEQRGTIDGRFIPLITLMGRRPVRYESEIDGALADADIGKSILLLFPNNADVHQTVGALCSSLSARGFCATVVGTEHPTGHRGIVALIYRLKPATVIVVDNTAVHSPAAPRSAKKLTIVCSFGVERRKYKLSAFDTVMSTKDNTEPCPMDNVRTFMSQPLERRMHSRAHIKDMRAVSSIVSQRMHIGRVCEDLVELERMLQALEMTGVMRFAESVLGSEERNGTLIHAVYASRLACDKTFAIDDAHEGVLPNARTSAVRDVNLCGPDAVIFGDGPPRTRAVSLHSELVRMLGDV
jgi:hypothetical protein